MDIANEVCCAEQRIRPHTRETILERSAYLSQLGDAEVHCKLENLQFTGSFKARGAMNKILSLAPEELARGVIAASTGNHGLAVARAARELDAPAIVLVPHGASPSKVRAIERFDADVRHRGDDGLKTEVHARRFAADNAMTYVSPYNDPLVIGGQGTVARELERQLERIDAVFVALGGGGLISGIAGYLKSVRPEVRIVGCSPENSAIMIESVRAGRILDLPSLPTLSDGTAGGVEQGSITFELCRTLVDEYVTVTEDEIAESLRQFTDAHHLLVEGAAAVAVASYVKTRERFAGMRVVVVICGGNISLETLKQVL
jgi:threonine dehydratase